ncbi:hypothetical protein FRC03_000161 [Tulasnella sp. 419]|nr:hypothetical protein FRC02_000460 [Tulasnella sp. 418]KAG8965790.1 hypothetical protein FRC03_000161 [Tulasnella sp. 419]
MADQESTNPPSGPLTNPQADADRIRLKRLAKLQSSTPSSSATSSPSRVETPPPKPKPIPPPSSKRPDNHPYAAPQPIHRPAAKVNTPLKFDYASWEFETIGKVLNVTLKKSEAENSQWTMVWLKELAQEIASEDPTLSLNVDIVDRLLIARLELSPDAVTDDVEQLQVIKSLPPRQSAFEYLTGCWKRLQSARSSLLRRGYKPDDITEAIATLDKMRELIVSYAGLCLQDPSMFALPVTQDSGAKELLPPLLSLSTGSPLTSLGSSSTSSSSLDPSDIEPFISDLAQRFENDGLEDILGGVFKELVDLIRLDAQGLASTGSDGGWRAALSAIEALTSVKSVASIMTRLPEWNPRAITAAFLEHLTLIGPPARLSVFLREWPRIAETYFSEPEKRTQVDIDSTNKNLRSTLGVLQQSLFSIFNSAVRAGVPSREAVLNYFAMVVQLNVKRGGMQVDPATVASDGYMINLQTSLLRFCEPFMDAKYSKIDKVDPLYFAHSSRLDISEETRVKATADEAKAFEEAESKRGAPSPNFISDIFFLTAAFNHYGLIRTISTHHDLEKHIDEIQQHLERIEGDRSFIGTPVQAQAEAAIARVKKGREKIHMELFAYQVQLLDPDLIFRTISYTTFLMTWLIRLVDPKKQHPTVTVSLPLPQEIPVAFRMLPEYLIEDIVEFYIFLIRHSPQSLDLAGKTELIDFTMTFLSSTGYIKNPYLKAKLVQILFFGTLPYGRERLGVLGAMLNTRPLALKHLMPNLMSFYVEVEQTGAHSQFYDKFDARRNIAYILKAVWDNPDHREALHKHANNLSSFVRFANLLMNDATYLLDESLGKLAEIRELQLEMEAPEWSSRPLNERQERERVFRTAENQATSYTTLGKSTVALLKDFTAISKAPFMTPEIVDRLAAMLDYNLDALVGPRCQNLHVKNMDKYRFNPRQLLSDILQVYLNLSDQPEFVRAVAGEGRSYDKRLFERAAAIATKRALKSGPEIEQLMMFVSKVEETKLLLEAEEDLGDIPDEFLDPLMYTIMRDPVRLPSSKAVVDRSTIKAHLLSDITDPFNRSPLSLEDVTDDTELKQRIDEWLAEKRKKGVKTDVPDFSLQMDVDD